MESITVAQTAGRLHSSIDHPRLICAVLHTVPQSKRKHLTLSLPVRTDGTGVAVYTSARKPEGALGASLRSRAVICAASTVSRNISRPGGRLRSRGRSTVAVQLTRSVQCRPGQPMCRPTCEPLKPNPPWPLPQARGSLKCGDRVLTDQRQCSSWSTQSCQLFSW